MRRPLLVPLLGLALVVAGHVPGTAVADEQPAPTLSLQPGTIDAGEQSTATGLVAPGQAVDLYGYSSPSTTYTLLDSDLADGSGRFAFPVAPSTDSRYYVSAGDVTSESAALLVRSVVTLDVQRLSGDTFVYSGTVSPGTPGTTVRVVFERDGERTVEAQAPVSRGRYRVTDTSERAGAFLVSARATSGSNAPGESAQQRVVVTPAEAGPQPQP